MGNIGGTVRLEGGLASTESRSGRCDSESWREPADRIRGMGGPFAAGCRGPSHLSLDGFAPRTSGSARDPKPIRVRIQYDFPYLRGRRGVLLVPRPDH